jgi:hypothetical protein
MTMPAAQRSPNPRPWRVQPLEVVKRAEADVIRLLQNTKRDITRQLAQLNLKDVPSARLRAMQIRLVKEAVAKEQARLWRGLGDVVKARRLEAAARVIALGLDFDRYLFNTLGHLGVSARDIARLTAAEEQAAKSGIDRMLQRVYGRSYVTLSQRVYTSSVNIGKVLDNRVNSALARGLSAKEFARELAPYIDPSTPGGLRYASMRLARTEINNAAHAMAVTSAQGKPWIEGMQWELSGSHPKPDECDDLAMGGLSGDGVYPVNMVPAKPHPQCFCTVVPISVGDEQFMLGLISGDYDDYASRYLNAA